MDGLRVHIRCFRCALPPDELVVGEGLGGIENQFCGVGVRFGDPVGAAIVAVEGPWVGLAHGGRGIDGSYIFSVFSVYGRHYVDLFLAGTA